MSNKHEAYNAMVKSAKIEVNKITLSDTFGFINDLPPLLPRRSNIGWEMVKMLLDILDDHDVTYCIFFGSLLGLLRCANEEPYIDDWDVALPNDAENLARLESAIEDMKSKKLFDTMNYPNNVNKAWGRQFVVVNERDLPHPQKRNFEYNTMPFCGHLDIFFIERDEKGYINWPRVNGKIWQDRFRDVPFSMVFPPEVININGDMVKLPACSSSPKLYDLVTKGYKCIPEEIIISTHWGNYTRFSQTTSHEDVLHAYYSLEDEAKSNMEKKINASLMKEWPSLPPNGDKFLSTSKEKFINLIPDVISCVDYKAKDGVCRMPSSHICFMGEVILYRPTYKYVVFGEFSQRHQCYLNLMNKHNQNLLVRREDILRLNVVASPVERHKTKVFNALLPPSDDNKKKEATEEIKRVGQDHRTNYLVGVKWRGA